MNRKKPKPRLIRRALSLTLSIVVAIPLAVVIGWGIDDVLLGHDIPRGVMAADAHIGGLDRSDAAERLAESTLGAQRIELAWAGHTLVSTAADLGISIDIEATIDSATERGTGASRPARWLLSLFDDDLVEPTLRVDNTKLGELFSTGDGSAFGVRFGLPDVELQGSRFVAVSRAAVPEVDIEALDRLLMSAALTPAAERGKVEVPSLGELLVDTADADLAARANTLTEGGIGVSLAASGESFHIPQTTLRSWVEFGGTRQNPQITLDPDRVLGLLRSLFVGLGEEGERSEFEIDILGEVRIVGGAVGSVCCQLDAHELILAALEDGRPTVRLHPIEDPDAKGVAWAESLEIRELVGEFTTNYKPNQTRVTNIKRIAEITQGAVIEPGETFSINEFVGRRTRADGFVSAGVISNGVFSSSVGGGISQYATTLFNAAFFAGLDFGEYQSHSIYISRYPYGREATMSFPHPDLQIINNTPYGILIWPTTTDTSITVSLYSTKWVEGEQTAQKERPEGAACIRVTTERTRTWMADGRSDTDTVTARYRPEGIACSGSSTVPTTTTIPPSTTTNPPGTTTTLPSTTTTSTTVPATTTLPSTTATPPTSTSTPPTTTTTTTMGMA